MPKTKKNKVFQQKRIPLLGELVDSVFTAMPILSLVSLVSTMIILYEVVKDYFVDIAPWLTIFHFFGGVVVMFVPVLLIVYKFIIPSVWHFRSTQMGHLEKKMDSVSDDLIEIKKALKKKEISGNMR